MSENKRIPYALWKVKDEEFKLKLTTSGIIALEEKLNTNLLNVLSSEGIPSLRVMLLIVHQALQKYHHGIKEKNVINMFDEYCEDGGNQTSFLTDVFIPIYQASGFMPARQSEEMSEKMEEAKEMLE